MPRSKTRNRPQTETPTLAAVYDAFIVSREAQNATTQTLTYYAPARVAAE